MAYVPQFIPTNTQILQGTLDQYQKAYDTETARMNQANDVYSSVPTTNPYDTTEKNRVMNEFKTKVIDELDKKYNYDRANTQYAKELSREITNLRANPLWSLVEQRGKVDDMRQKLMQERGSDYFENFDPNTKTSIADLKNWQSMDIKDLERQIALAGKEYATSHKSTTTDNTTVPGILRVVDQFGFSTTENAARFLGTTPGKNWLDQAIQGTGFEKYINDNPQLKERAYNAALSNLVGESKIDMMKDPGYDASGKGSGSGSGSGSGLMRVSNQSPEVLAKPYGVQKASDLYQLDDNIKVIDKKIEEASKDPFRTAEVEKLKADKQAAQLQRDEAYAVKEKAESQPEAQKLITKLKSDINSELDKYKTFIRGDKASEIYDEILPIMIKTTGGKSNAFSPLSNENKTAIATKVTEILSKYTDPNRKGDKNIASALPGISKDIVDKINYWYLGKENYPADGSNPVGGYKQNVIDKISEQLTQGDSNIFDTMAPVADITSAEYKQHVDNAIRNMDFLIPKESEFLQGGDSGLNWNADKLKQVKQAMLQEGTRINYLFDNEDRAFIQLNNPGTTTKGGISDAITVTLEVDPTRSSADMLKNLASMTGDSRFLNVIHSSFNLATDKKYSIDSTKDTTLKDSLKNHPYFSSANGEVDLTGLDGISIKKTKDKTGALSYELYLSPDDKTPSQYPNKGQLLEALYKYSLPDKIAAKTVTRNMNATQNKEKIQLTDATDFNSYANLIGKQESGNNYNAQNGIGALGKYQFMPSTLRGLGYDINGFLENPEIQDQAMMDLTMANIDSLRKYGYNINPNKLTPEGLALLAVSHYGGINAAKALLEDKEWIYKPQYENEGDKTIKYPSVIDYLEQSLGLKVKGLNFESLKK